jgi:hypothetical protein
MDALGFLRERTKTQTGRIVFCILCLMPVLGGVIGHLIGRNSGTFMDIDAVLCAARAEAGGLSPYGTPHCPGLAPAAYVYAPQVAGWFIPLIHMLGMTGARWAYAALLFFPALALMLWYALCRPVKDIDWRIRMLAVSGLAPMVFCSGNFGVVMHALVISSLLVWPRKRWVFLAAVLLCVAIKPTFLLYLLVPLFEARPWRQRLITVVASIAAGAFVLAVTTLTAGPLAAQWHNALGSVALHDQPGLGWFALTAMLNMAPGAPGTIGLTLVFMAAMVASGLAIAEAAGLDDDERKVLALGLVPLLTPRLMDYDMLALVPLMALVIRVMPVLGGRIFRYNVSWLFVGVLGFGMVTNVLHLLRQWPRSHAAMAVFCLVVLAGGGRVLMTELEKRRGPLARKREKATLGSPLRIRRAAGGEDARGEVAGKVR